jgi:apolipoprotein N-acyltransferase
MQPNTGQGSDFSFENKDVIMRHYLELSDRATSPTSTGIADVTHLIWPESAFPFFLARDPEALNQIASLLHGGAVLITGAARADTSAHEGGPRYYNSIQVVDSHGGLLDRYDKTRLVPVGEYLPFRKIFDRLGVTQMVHIPGGFDPGERRKLLRSPGLPDALPMVCYEAIFPDELGTLFDNGPRAEWILNVTDDIWFGRTAGPYQHFAQARLRAVEQGLPLVRDGNSGVTAVTDGLGRITAELPFGIDGVLDAALPTARPPTIYARYGALGPAALLLAYLVGWAILSRRRR